MIDFHCHILPGIDDGSSDINETMELLTIERTHGVTDIVFTPHFYAEFQRGEKFLEKRQKSYAKTLDAMQSAGMHEINTYLGAEVCYFQGIGRASMVPKLCIGDSNVMLLELPFTQWEETLIDYLQALMKKQKIKIIIAHMERYYDFQKKKNIWNQVLELPMVFQINTGSFLKKKKMRKLCFRIMENRDNILLGSDCHNTSVRLPNLKDGREVIEKHLGRETLDRIDAKGTQILREWIKNEEK